MSMLMVALVAVLGLLGANELYVRWGKVTWRGALGMLLAATGIAAVVVVRYESGQWQLPLDRLMRSGEFFVAAGEREWISLVALMVACVMGVGWVGKLYAVWVLGRVRGDEGRRDARCVRAWLGPVNVLLMALFVVSAWAAWGWVMEWTAVAGAAVLLAYPVVHVGVVEEGEVREDLAEERRRVLAMVEMGKISGEDGAELIEALRGEGKGERVLARGLGGSVAGRMMGLGAVLVAAGFFLPWFRVPLELGWMREVAAGMGAFSPSGKFDSGVVLSVHGADLAHGLGWAVLAMGVLPALLGLMWTGDAASRRGLTLGMLAVGSVVAVYVASLGVRFGAEGLWMVMAGYAVMWAGAVRGLGGVGAQARGVAVG